MTTARRKPAVRVRRPVTMSLAPETLAAIDDHAAAMPGPAVPSRSAAIDDLVRIAGEALAGAKRKPPEAGRADPGRND